MDIRLENVVDEKLSREIIPLGQKAGEITNKASELTGLKVGTSVAIANVDAHVTVPAVKIYEPGKILGVIGTSGCYILLGEEEKEVPGMAGVVEDGVIPGYFGYEAGLASVGDSLSWFVNNCVPKNYIDEAEKENISIHDYLSNKAKKLKVGETGLIALDWLNGNRSILVDVDLSGLILGIDLQTKPEEIYRALLETTAFGTRVIIENFRKNGIPVEEFYASGGIPIKNPFMMQIYADVLDMPIYIAGSKQGPALGSAIFAALAAGKERGGYDSIVDASLAMGKLKDIIYEPKSENKRIYDEIYEEYLKLHDYFGTTENNVMKKLKKIKMNN